MGLRPYVELCALRVGHPDRQVRQRSIPLLHNVGCLTAIAVLTNDQHLLAMAGVEAVMNRHLRTVGMGSMSLASAVSARPTF
jgi:hypothetical protein